MTAAFQSVSRAPLAVLPRSELPIRLGVLTPHNPYDRQSFSGTVFHAVQALDKHSGLDLRILGPHQPQTGLQKFLRRPQQRLVASALRARDFDGLDAVLGLVASPLLDHAAHLTDIPFLHVTDATPGFLRDAYGRDVPSTADVCEARVLDRAMAIYSSRFMAKQANTEFGMTQTRALHFGVNLPFLQQDLPPKPNFDPIELLYVGGNWDRKGGAIALDAMRILQKRGLKVRLTLVGNVPKPIRKRLKGDRTVNVTGFLNKNRSRDAVRLEALYRRSHLFVLPTRADCTPMVVAEALAHHTPVLATDVGGVTEMIGAGAGRTLPIGADARTWANSIAEITADRMAYDFMADAAGERTTVELNWNTWAKGIAAIAADMVLECAAAA